MRARMMPTGLFWGPTTRVRLNRSDVNVYRTEVSLSERYG